MVNIYEIYLNKKYVTKDEWLSLINTISNYNGILRSWKIIVTNNKNNIRYFIKTRCNLPATINNLETFLLRRADDITLSRKNSTLLFFPKIGSSLIDIINHLEIRSMGSLKYLEITFLKYYEDKIKMKTYFYLSNKDYIRKYRILLALVPNILSIDFEGNKRYFYKSIPKYLDINKILHLLDSDSRTAILKVDTFPYLQGNFYLNQNNYNFDKHSIIIGSSGCGKSKFISLLIDNINKINDLKIKYKFVIIDPHASLEDDIGGIGSVIDFSKLNSIDLFINNIDDIISSTELLLELFKSLMSEQYNSKLERVLRHSIHILLTNKSFNFNSLRKLLLDIEYRSFLIKKFEDKLTNGVIDFFLSDFNELKTKSYGESISPIISFIDEMEMIPVFNSTHSFESLTDTLKNNFLTLFSLDRTKLGDKVIKTISGLIMQQLLTIIQNRKIDEHIILIIDEVAVVENPILTRFLAEARKYNLSLILAGQYFNQISNNLKNAIFANVVNYYIFRVSRLDANILVDNFNMKIPLDDTREKKVNLLTELNNRECIVRIDSNGILLPAFKATTLDFRSIPRVNSNTKNNDITDNKPDIICKKKDFKINNNINLKTILLATSSSRKELR